jgi:hypothetical protein
MLRHPDRFEAQRLRDAREFRRMSILSGERDEQSNLHFFLTKVQRYPAEGSVKTRGGLQIQ